MGLGYYLVFNCFCIKSLSKNLESWGSRLVDQEKTTTFPLTKEHSLHCHSFIPSAWAFFGAGPNNFNLRSMWKTVGNENNEAANRGEKTKPCETHHAYSHKCAQDHLDRFFWCIKPSPNNSHWVVLECDSLAEKYWMLDGFSPFFISQSINKAKPNRPPYLPGFFMPFFVSQSPNPRCDCTELLLRSLLGQLLQLIQGQNGMGPVDTSVTTEEPLRFWCVLGGRGRGVGMGFVLFVGFVVCFYGFLCCSFCLKRL